VPPAALLANQAGDEGVVVELLPLRVRAEQVRDALAQRVGAPREQARDRLVQGRADEAEHEVDEDQPERDVEGGCIQHTASLATRPDGT
jgi:hypothetical protein